MYEVNVNADPAKFLDWDAPLSEQHPDVQAALGKVFDAADLAGSDRPAGARAGSRLAITTLASLAWERKRRRALNEAGIPGIGGISIRAVVAAREGRPATPLCLTPTP